MILVMRKLYRKEQIEIPFGVFDNEFIANAEIQKFLEEFSEYDESYFRKMQVSANTRCKGNGSLGL